MGTNILAFLVIPIAVHKLGMAGYGVWEILFTIATLGCFCQSPITYTMLWALSKAYSQGDMRVLNRKFGIGLTANVAQFFLILALLSTILHPIAKLFQLPDNAIPLLPLVLGGSLLTGFAEATAAATSGAQRMALNSYMRSAGLVLQYSISIVMVLTGFGLKGMALGLVANNVVYAVGSSLIARRVVPELRFRLLLPNKAEIHELYGYAGSMMAASISSTLRGQLDRLVLAHFANPSWVGYYGVATRLCNLIFEFTKYIYMPIIPAAAALHAQNDVNGLNRLFARFMTLTGFVTGSVTVIIAGLSGRFLIAWIGACPKQCLLLLALLISSGFLQLVFTGPGTAICRGIGRTGIETSYLTLSLVINLVLTIVLVSTIGFIGTVIASAVATTIGSTFYCFVLHKKTFLPVSETWRAVRNCLAVLLTVGSLHFISGMLPVPGGRIHELVWLAPLSVLAVVIYSVLFLLLKAGDPISLAPVASRSKRMTNLVLSRVRG